MWQPLPQDVIEKVVEASLAGCNMDVIWDNFKIIPEPGIRITVSISPEVMISITNSERTGLEYCQPETTIQQTLDNTPDVPENARTRTCLQAMIAVLNTVAPYVDGPGMN